MSTEPIATRCCSPADSDEQRPVAQLRKAEQVKGFLDPPPHHVGRDAERLHAVRELVLDGVGDESGERILPDVPDDVGELAGREVAGVAAGDGDPAREPCRR